MLRRTRYKQTNSKASDFGFLIRQCHAVIYFRSLILHGGDIPPFFEYAIVVFLLYSADLLDVQKRERTFGDTFEVLKQSVFKGKLTEFEKIVHIVNNGNGIQAVGAVDEVFIIDGFFVFCMASFIS